VGHDDRHDAALGGAHGAAVRCFEPQAEGKRQSLCVTSLFVSAYLVAWASFSTIAVGLQWGLENAALLSPMLVSASAVLGGMLLLAAGIYQLTPLKRACLKHCRSPLQFILTHWRSGASGAFRMGIQHGAYCVGCCWVLMGLLFFGGIMNLYWIIGLAAFVLLEKSIPMGHWLGNLVGIALIAWGTAVLAGALPLRFLGMA
jgi:predicted metal-binding membrane protein